MTETCQNPWANFSIVGMVVYLLAFGVGMGGMPWTVNSEIYPLQYKNVCLGLSTGCNWMSNILVSATFLTLSENAVLTVQGAFWMYATVAVLGWVWLYKVMPETKGLALEEVAALFHIEGGESPQVGR